MAIRNILFDFDGTIADTAGLVMDSWQHTFVTCTGEKGDERTIYRTFGERLVDSLARLIPMYDPEETVRIYRDYQASLGEDVWEMFDGMPELIEALKKRGIRQAIVTSRTGVSTRAALSYFDMENTFDAVVTCEDTNIHKPEPAPALIGLAKLDASPAETLFVGDTRYDIGCAHNAGVRAVLVGWTHSMEDEDKVGIFKPDFEIKTPMELLEVIDRC
ncbi:MAG: HAD-IA family hydrolase [Eubacterium sp.]|nr:HAD-IA family hydrolase [Eubacterium sp.]